MIRATDLIGARLVTESGERLGRIHDLRLERDDRGWRLAGLVISGFGLLERLGASGFLRSGPMPPGDAYPWEAVIRLTADEVVVHDRAEPL